MGGDVLWILSPPPSRVAATVISAGRTVTRRPRHRQPRPSPPATSSRCHRPLPASDDPDGDGVRELPGCGIRDVAPNLPFLAHESGLGEEDDLGEVTQGTGATTPRRVPPGQPSPAPRAPCTLPGLVLILKPSLSSCCGHPRGREEHGGTSAAPAISPQPEGAAAATSRLLFAAPSQRPEQPHLEHSCTVGTCLPSPARDLLSPPRDPPIIRGATRPSLELVPFCHLPWYLLSPIPAPSVTRPGTSRQPPQHPPVAPGAVTPCPL